MFDTTRILLLGATGLVSLGAAAFLALRSRRAGARGERDRPADAVALVGLGTGYLLAHVALVGWPSWEFWEHRPAFIAPAAVLAGALVTAMPIGTRMAWARLGVALLLAGAVTALLVLPAARTEWAESGDRAAGVALLAAWCAAWLALTATPSAPATGRAWPASLFVISGGVAVVAFQSHYLKFALIAGAIAAILLPPALAAFAGSPGRPRPGRGTWLVWSALLVSLLLGAYLHTVADNRAPLVSFVLVGAAPLLSGLADLGGATRAGPRRELARLLLVLLPVLAGALLAIFSEPTPPPSANEEWMIGY